MSAEDASFNSWIKEYRPDENSINSQISYYDKGELLGMLLDLEIRRRSNNAKSLDDVMRMLYNDFFKKNRNYTPADFQKVCETAAGSSLEDFFAHYVRGTDELPYRWDQLQYEHGEGPCLGAIAGNTVEVVPDLRTENRWPMFARAIVHQSPVRSMLSSGLFLTKENRAGLNLYATRPGAFTEQSTAAGSISMNRKVTGCCPFISAV